MVGWWCDVWEKDAGCQLAGLELCGVLEDHFAVFGVRELSVGDLRVLAKTQGQ
jgi:hypothetical protein